MNPENKDILTRDVGVGRPPFDEPGSANLGVEAPFGGAIVALFRIGTRKARLAAALMVVVAGLVAQSATQALAQARETVLYLDAPAVSTDRATRAGEVARAYSDPRSPAHPDALAWLGVRPSQGNDTEAPPPDAESAFASITAPEAECTQAITAEAAYEAGETMLAQIEDGVPSGDGSPRESDLAAAGGAVRPELGDGTQASEHEPSETHEAPSAEQPTTPGFASSPAEPTPGTAAEPSGGEGLALETPAPASDPAEIELASVPSEDVSPAPETYVGKEPEHGATGPISEPAHVSSTNPSGGSGVQEPEARKPEAKDEEIQDPDHGRGELAAAEPAPASVASPAPADKGANDGDESAYAEPAAEEPTYDHAAAPPATGPTSTPGDDGAPVASSSPPPADDSVTDDGGADDLASASPTPEEGSGQDNALGQDLSKRQATAVVIVQESEPAGGSGPSAMPEESAPPAGEPVPTSRADAPQEESAPETQTEARPDTEASPLPADQGTGAESASADDASAPEQATPDQELDAGDDPDSHGGPDPAPNSEDSSDTASSPPTGEPGEDPGEAAGGQTDEVPDPSGQDSEEATPTDEPAPAPEDDTTAHNAASPAEDGGGRAGPRDTAEQSPAPGDDGSSASPTTEPQAEGQATEDQDQEPSAGSQTPNYSIRTVEPADADPRSTGGDRAASAGRRMDDEHPRSTRRQPDTNPVASQSASEPQPAPEPASERYSAASENRDAKNGRRTPPSNPSGTPSFWDRRGVHVEQSGNRPSVQRVGFLENAGDRRAQARAEARADRLARQQAARRAERRQARRVEKREARQERIAYRQRVAAEGDAPARRADRRAERHSARRAEIFAAGVAERQAERRANRIRAMRAERRATDEQVAIERSATERSTIRDQRGQNRLAAGASNAPAPPAVAGRNAPAGTQPMAVELAPVQQVSTQRFVPADQTRAPQVPPARQVQSQVPVQPRRQTAPGGAGLVGGGGVPGAGVQMPDSINRATGR